MHPRRPPHGDIPLDPTSPSPVATLNQGLTGHPSTGSSQ
eukprot:CAMPEP_0181443884 /NCGR_PEP_ID=MMETSP1110-20121109/24781_1 /TAXON_ID=174948 /ORGANISM="Symbiodinium sp., Strain CCMP421" /LENGTH=38 /DNA_ID= /DNA_START= /DNA_END= /DNA_ORIENTATION=